MSAISGMLFRGSAEKAHKAKAYKTSYENFEIEKLTEKWSVSFEDALKKVEAGMRYEMSISSVLTFDELFAKAIENLKINYEFYKQVKAGKLQYYVNPEDYGYEIPDGYGLANPQVLANTVKDQFKLNESETSDNLTRIEKKIIALKQIRELEKDQFVLKTDRKKLQDAKEEVQMTMTEILKLSLKEVKKKMQEKLANGQDWNSVSEETKDKYEAWLESDSPLEAAKKLSILIKQNYKKTTSPKPKEIDEDGEKVEDEDEDVLVTQFKEMQAKAYR